MKHVLLTGICLVANAVTAADSATDMSRRIDERLAARWRSQSLTPAPLAADAEFLRRVTLDLTGVVPRVADVRAFLRDTAADKRARRIEELLQSPAHATHMANTWRKTLLPDSFEPEQLANVAGLQNWLRRQFADNRRYDQVVADFLVATGGGQTGPAVFYTALEVKPEKLAAATARVFLGLQIECAECHDHPFDRWKQDEFWGYAAFFARVQRPENGRANRLVDLTRGEVRLPGTDTVVPPKYPGGIQPGEDDFGHRRMQLAIWLASRDNPYLARAAVNRVWAQLFGRGLVEPVDDLSPRNPPSHPELLDELAEFFTESGFDLRALYRTLTNTRGYQRASQLVDAPPDAFASQSLRPLTPDQLYDSLRRVLAPPRAAAMTPQPLAAVDQERLAFVAKMATPGRSPTEYQSGVLHALTLLNGSETAGATDAERCGLLASLDAPFLRDEDRVEVLFLATLSRDPTESERRQFLDHVHRNPARRSQSLGDILWALLNSAEFALNH